MTNTTDTDNTSESTPILVPVDTSPSGGLISRLTRPRDEDDSDEG